MNKLLFLILILCNSSYSWSNQRRLDSLQSVYLTARGTAKVDAAIEYARKIPPSDSVNAIAILKDALRIAKEKSYSYGQIRVNHFLGWYYVEILNNRNKGIPLYKTAIDLATKHKNYNELFWVYALLKDAYVFVGDYISAINLLNEAMNTAENTATANKYLASIYAGLFQCYGGLGDFDRANEVFKQGVKLAIEANDVHELWFLYSSMADIRMLENKPKVALAYLNKAIEIGDKTKESYNVLNLQTKVDILIQLNRIREAETLCWKIRDAMATMAAYDFVGSNNASLSYIYLAHKNYEKALEYALRSYEETKATGDIENLVELDTTLAKIYELKGDFQRSNYYNKHYIQQHSQILKKERILEYQSKQYDKYIKSIESAKKSKQIYVFLSLFLFLILLLGIAFFVIKHRNTQLEVRLLDEIAKAEEEKRLKMQIEMDSKARELTMMAMAADQKNALWQSVQQKLKEKLNDLPSVSEKEVRDVFKIIAQNSDTNDEWGTFKVHFESVHPQFFTILSQINANLTHLELRQCAYIKINLSPKQVSNLLNITPDSVKKARLRIKKKLNLSTEDSLTKFIATIQG